MVNKKGQEMSVATLVLIVIGIVVLVMLILGFSMGWKNLWGKITGVSGSDVETAIQSCTIAATSDSTYSYCNDWKKVTIDGKTEYMTCSHTTIQNRLDKRLNCAGSDAPDAVATAKCNSITAAGGKVDDTKYNGKVCTAPAPATPPAAPVK